MKLKLFVLLLIISLLSGCADSKVITGHWSGSMEMNGKAVDLSIDLNSGKNLLTSRDMMLVEKPITNLSLENGNINFSVVLDVEVIFDGELKSEIKGEQINGTAAIIGGPPNMDIVFELTKQPEAPVKPYSVENLTIKSNDVTLAASIYKPKTQGQHPALVLLHGSSTNLKSDYIYDADFYARLGFEVLIFDKRGNGKSTGEYYLSTYENLIADAIVCLEFMNARESVDKTKIGLWGYSQGALLLPKVVEKTNIPTFLIAKSPEIVSVVEAAAYSDSLRVVSSGSSKSYGHIVAESHRKVGKMIRSGSDYQEVENFIRQNARQYNFMNQTGLYNNLSIDQNEYDGFYWKGRTENFYSYWKNLNIPTLVLFGERDTLVDAERNALLLNELKNEHIEVFVFPSANHHLKKMFNPATDTEFDWPRLIEGCADYVEKWVEEQF